MNKKTRAVAIVLVAVLVLSLVASMVAALSGLREKETEAPSLFLFSSLAESDHSWDCLFRRRLPFLRRDFRQCCLIMMPLRGGQAMTVVYVDSVFCLNTADGLSALAAAPPVWPAFRCGGGAICWPPLAGRRLCGGGVFARDAGF